MTKRSTFLMPFPSNIHVPVRDAAWALLYAYSQQAETPYFLPDIEESEG